MSGPGWRARRAAVPDLRPARRSSKRGWRVQHDVSWRSSPASAIQADGASSRRIPGAGAVPKARARQACPQAGLHCRTASPAAACALPSASGTGGPARCRAQSPRPQWRSDWRRIAVAVSHARDFASPTADWSDQGPAPGWVVDAPDQPEAQQTGKAQRRLSHRARGPGCAVTSALEAGSWVYAERREGTGVERRHGRGFAEARIGPRSGVILSGDEVSPRCIDKPFWLARDPRTRALGMVRGRAASGVRQRPHAER